MLRLAATLAVFSLLTVSPLAYAVPAVDGTADAKYGAALSVQNTNTHFGDSRIGDPIRAQGSEIDQVFGKIDDGRLYVTIAGNLQTNFDKLVVFLDSSPGGVNTIDGNGLPRGFDPYCCGHFPPPDGGNVDNIGGLQRMNGLTFDEGFEADHLLSFTAGFEDALDPNLHFYALSAHYADLTQGTSGAVGGLGVQFAQRGLPNVLRGTTADADVDGDVDGRDVLNWQRNVGNTGGLNRTHGDANYSGAVDHDDLTILSNMFGFDVANAQFNADWFAPQNPVDDSDAVVGPALPELAQGELVDKNYAFGPGGAADNAGAGAITRELEFVLPVIAGTNNAANHRHMENIVDLQMALDNSNTTGVEGSGPYTTPTLSNPGNVLTGLEFSIPLPAIGNPTGPIKLFAFINNWAYRYASNQFSGVGILDANLGGNGFGGETGDLSGVRMTDFFGDQFVTIPAPTISAIPEPNKLLLLAMAIPCLARLPRKTFPQASPRQRQGP